MAVAMAIARKKTLERPVSEPILLHWHAWNRQIAPLPSTHLKNSTKFSQCFFLRMPKQGNTVRFWEQDWGLGVLKNKFDMLYTFSTQQQTSLQQALQLTDAAEQFRENLSLQATEQLQVFQRQITQYKAQYQQNRILGIEADTVSWPMTSDGIFKVSSAYFVMQDGPAIKSTANRIWKLRTPPRYKIFGWLLMHNKILTVQNLKKRGFQLPGICYMCWKQDETAHHMFNECGNTREIYIGVLNQAAGYKTGQNNIQSMTDKNTPKIDRELLLITNFTVWRERCNRIFREVKKNTRQLIDEAIDQWKASTTQQPNRNYMMRQE